MKWTVLPIIAILLFISQSSSQVKDGKILVGRRFGVSFHQSSCLLIPPSNSELDSLIHFSSIDDALAAGYEPCSQCIEPINPERIAAARRQNRQRIRHGLGRPRPPIILAAKLGSKSWLLEPKFKISQGPAGSFYLGLSAGMTWSGGGEPPGIPFDGNAFSWWVYKAEYRKRGVQLLGSLDFVFSTGLFLGAAFGYGAQERFDVYWSTATYWEWYKSKDAETKPIGTATLGYLFNDSFGISLTGSTAGEVMGGILVGWTGW
ncbi:MAG: hypothetical protein AB1428_12925 [Bacteroidota bacterium]